MARRRRAVIGLVPWLWRRLVRTLAWAVAHPQTAAATALCLLGLWGLIHHAKRTDAFLVRAVHVPPHSGLQVRGTLIGTNLWEVDLQALAQDLRRQQPWLHDVRVVRELPNTIRIEPIARQPVAQVRLDRWYPVDRSGYILPRPVGAEEALARLTGLERDAAPLRSGQPNSQGRLGLALRVLSRLQASQALTARRLVELDVSDPAQLRFVLDGEMEIRCGSETELAAQLQRLEQAMEVLAAQSMEARYIDLRFQDPVVGPKT